VNKDSEGREKKVDIETPIGGLHVSKGADVRDTGLPVYPGARRKEKDEDGDSNSANVNISSSLFGLKVVAVEYLSDDSPKKIIAYYTSQLRKYGNVLECHTNKNHVGANIDPDDDSVESKPLKCEGDNNGKVVELKVGTDRTSTSSPSNPRIPAPDQILAWCICRCEEGKTRSDSKFLDLRIDELRHRFPTVAGQALDSTI